MPKAQQQIAIVSNKKCITFSSASDKTLYIFETHINFKWRFSFLEPFFQSFEYLLTWSEFSICKLSFNYFKFSPWFLLFWSNFEINKCIYWISCYSYLNLKKKCYKMLTSIFQITLKRWQIQFFASKFLWNNENKFVFYNILESYFKISNCEKSFLEWDWSIFQITLCMGCWSQSFSKGEVIIN